MAPVGPDRLLGPRLASRRNVAALVPERSLAPSRRSSSRCLRPASGTWAVAPTLKRLVRQRNASLANTAKQLPASGIPRKPKPRDSRRPTGKVEVDLDPPGVNLDQALETALRINDERQATKQQERK